MRLRKLVIASIVVFMSALSFAGGAPDKASDVCPIKVGESLPENVVLKGLNGKDVKLGSLIKKKPTVLIFYRGSWCPYCNVHLGELKTIEKDLIKLGYQIVGVSPDLPENLQKSVDKNKLDYQLVSDAKGELIKALGLAFRVDDETYKIYQGYNIDLEKASGEKHRLLPVPAAIVVDRKGTVQFNFSSPDYKVRIKPEVLLAAAKAYK